LGFSPGSGRRRRPASADRAGFVVTGPR
jgi:hypothetical protein